MQELNENNYVLYNALWFVIFSLLRCYFYDFAFF